MWRSVANTGRPPLTDAVCGADRHGSGGGGGGDDDVGDFLPPLSPLRPDDDGVVQSWPLPAELGDRPPSGDGCGGGGGGGDSDPGFPLSALLGEDGGVSPWLPRSPESVVDPAWVEVGGGDEARPQLMATSPWSTSPLTPPLWPPTEATSPFSPLFPSVPAARPAVARGTSDDVTGARHPAITPEPQPETLGPLYGRWGSLKSSGWGVDTDKVTNFDVRIASLDADAREWLFPDGLSCAPWTTGSGGRSGGVGVSGGDGLSPAAVGVDPLSLQPVHVTSDAISAGLYREKTVISYRTRQVLNSMAMLVVPSHTTAAGWLLGWVFAEWTENDTASLEVDVPPCTAPVTRVALDGSKSTVALAAYFEDGSHVQFDVVEAVPNGGGVNKEQYIVRRGSGGGEGGSRARIIHATVSHMEQSAEVTEPADTSLQVPFLPLGEDGGMLGPLSTGHYFGGLINSLAGLRLTDDGGSAAPPPLPPDVQLWGPSGWASSLTDRLLLAPSMMSDAPDPALSPATRFELHVDTPGYVTRLRLRAAALGAAKPCVPAWRPLGGCNGGQQAPHRRLAVCASPAASPPFPSDKTAPLLDEWSQLVPDPPPVPFPVQNAVEGALPALPMDWMAGVSVSGDDGNNDLAAAAAAATAEWAVPAAADGSLPTSNSGGATCVAFSQWAVSAVASGGLSSAATGGAAPVAAARARTTATTPPRDRAVPIAPASSDAAAVLYAAAAAVAASTAAGATVAGAPTAGGAPSAAGAPGGSRRRGPLSPEVVANPVRYARMLRNRESARRSNERRRVARLAAKAAKEAERQASAGTDAASSSAGGGSGTGGGAATPD